MNQTVAVPYWLLLLIIAFAAVSFASNFLFPSVRWFFRARMERALVRLNTRLDRPIDLFKLAERQDRIARLIYDSKVMDAVAEHAAETGLPVPVVFEEARRYAREIVPGFSTTLYFGVAIRLARGLSRTLYRVRFGKPDGALRQIDQAATVVFVMNHRSNMDYVLVTWLVAKRASISYAVGEWARIWPLSVMIRTMGAYFIRRSSRNALYRKVLARYVQMTTAEGITQAIFPEGGLSLDGRVGEAKLGLLSYIVAGYSPGGRDVVFVPVGIAYDRVLEDGLLTKAAQEGNRRFPANPFGIVFGALNITVRVLLRRFKGFGTAAAAFGDPVSLAAFMGQREGATIETLGRHLMDAISQVVPVVPVPLVVAALQTGPTTRAGLTVAVQDLITQLEAAGAVFKLAPAGIEATVDEALAPLLARKLIRSDLTPVPGAEARLEFYAASIRQRLEPVTDEME
jgi:glycerol-3-phosphate O-acyltransferase